MKDIMISFSEPGRLTAYNMAEKALKAAGFSVGHLQAGDPSGILLGEWDIQKWRNLRAREKSALHGILKCIRGSETATVQFFGKAMAADLELWKRVRWTKWLEAGAVSTNLEAASDAA